MYKPTKIIELLGGTGSMSLAAAREKIASVSIARNEAHMNFMREYVIASIVAENIGKIDEGFLCSRFLSRHNSLESAGSGDQAAVAAAAEVAQAPNKPSSSSSSSASEDE